MHIILKQTKKRAKGRFSYYITVIYVDLRFVYTYIHMCMLIICSALSTGDKKS